MPHRVSPPPPPPSSHSSQSSSSYSDFSEAPPPPRPGTWSDEHEEYIENNYMESAVNLTRQLQALFPELFTDTQAEYVKLKCYVLWYKVKVLESVD
ncbi:hypothetical protein MMC25_000778 [Agyrium rufum]|nr:hypothetical protein [Agyrium rufum]